jgi:phospholipid/cholesterol/gamma-HCH transport system substrate-binding protein
MIQRKYETIVGLFVLGSLAALLIMVLIIAQQERLWEKHVEYRAVFKNIGGLKEGSEVRLAGVTVGNVRGITIDPEGQIIVTFEVIGKYSSRVRQDSRATIGYQGLLGDKSLDLTAGSPDQPEIPAKGTVASVEPLDITEMITKAQPSLENLQKLLSNLARLSESLTEPEGDFAKSMEELRQIVNKINQGQGSLGQVLNDPKLYRESAEAMANLRKFSGNLEEGKGLITTLAKDEAFKAEAQRAMANFSQASAEIKEGTSRFPEMAKKADSFMTQLNRAGKGLPGLVFSGETMFNDVDKAAKAAQKSWLLRRHVPKAKEQTIRLR